MSIVSPESVINLQAHDLLLVKFKKGVETYLKFYRKYGDADLPEINHVRNKMKLTIEGYRREAVRINAWDSFWNQYVSQGLGKMRLNEIDHLEFHIPSLKRLLRN